MEEKTNINFDMANVSTDSLRAAAVKSRHIMLMENERPVARVTFLEGENYDCRHTD